MKTALLLLTVLICQVSALVNDSDDGSFRRLRAEGILDKNSTSLDYFFQLLNGLKADDYVPGSIECSLDAIATQTDLKSLFDYFQGANDKNRPVETKKNIEHSIFTSIRLATANLPSTIYNCYFIPQVANLRWGRQLDKFQDLEVFEAGFVQNLMGVLGNVLSIQDIIGKINEAMKEEDNEMIVYQVGRLFRRIFDFEPMKNASYQPSKKQLQASPFDKPPTVQEMRDLHDSIILTEKVLPEDDDDEPRVMGHRPIVRESFFVNRTAVFAMPFYGSLGFVEGAFAAQNQTQAANITSCRLNSLRFGNNVTLLAWHSELDYGVDRVIRYATDLATQFYPFSYHCYYTVDEAVEVASSDDFMNQEFDAMLVDAIYEMRSNTDAARRILQLISDVRPQRIEQGHGGFMSKDWYVIGFNLGVIFNNIAQKGYHTRVNPY